MLGSCIYRVCEGSALPVCDDIIQTIDQEFGTYSTANLSPKGTNILSFWQVKVVSIK
jgi:hypothetical protein